MKERDHSAYEAHPGDLVGAVCVNPICAAHHSAVRFQSPDEIMLGCSRCLFLVRICPATSISVGINTGRNRGSSARVAYKSSTRSSIVSRFLPSVHQARAGRTDVWKQKGNVSVSHSLQSQHDPRTHPPLGTDTPTNAGGQWRGASLLAARMRGLCLPVPPVVHTHARPVRALG